MNPTYFPTRPVLLVDDEEQFLFSTSLALNADGINHVVQCQDSREVMPILTKTDFSVVVLDMLMPDLSGWDLLPLILADFPELPVTVVTAVNRVENAVECMRNGAYDYLLKPVDSTRLAATVRRGVEIGDLRRQNRQLKDRLLSDALEQPEAFSDIITQDRTMYSIFQYIEAIAQTTLPVLITGETGVGKELIAASIHKLSGLEGEFVSVNIAGLDD
jgi:DNA-binding NtrC family response regulator